MSELTPRKRTILRAVIVEYVDAAEPVASETLAQKYALGVRSATIRNELAEMSELGFLEQPHTSAGRIPSDSGYRFYVDHLIEPKDLDSESKRKVKKTTADDRATQELLRATTKLLSGLTHLLSAATTVNNAELKVQHLAVSALGPEKALVVLVLANGHVENRMVACPTGLTLTQLGMLNTALEEVGGLTLRQVARLNVVAGPDADPFEQMRAATLATARAIAKDLTSGKLITEGEEFMLSQPEFQRDPSSLNQLLDALGDEGGLYDALTAGKESAAPQVTIGRENRPENLRRLTVVRQHFYVGGEDAGTLAIIGPTRMDYEGATSLLNYTAQAVSETLTRLLR